MRKTVLILILCAPLFWLTFQEGLRLYQVSAWSTAPARPADDENRPKPADLKKARDEAAAIVDLREGVAATIIRLDKPPPGAPSDDPLESALVEHARTRAKGREQVERAMVSAKDVEKKINDALHRMLGPGGRPVRPSPDLKGLLEEYEKDIHDPELLASAQAEQDWPELEKNHGQTILDELYTVIDHWSPAKAEKNLPGPADFEVHAAAYRDYLKDHEAAKGAVAVTLTRDARERLALLERGAKLGTSLNDPANDRIAQLKELVKLDDDNPPARFRTSLRRLVQVLCDDLLKREDYDENVLLASEGAPEPAPVKRKDLQVVLKNGQTVNIGPPPAGVDEYTLQADQVDSFSLPMGDIRNPPGPGIPPLKGTPYSNAIRAFNTERDRIKHWSEPELLKLLETCEKNKADLQRGSGSNPGGQTLIVRITALIEILRGHPSVFVPNAP